MVALQEKRAGLGFVAVKSAAGRAGDLDVIVNFHTVAVNRHVAADQRDIERGPLAEIEWDVAAGAALVTSAGGYLATLNRSPFRANNRDPLLSGLIACGPNLRDPLLQLLEPHLRSTTAPPREG